VVSRTGPVSGAAAKLSGEAHSRGLAAPLTTRLQNKWSARAGADHRARFNEAPSYNHKAGRRPVAIRSLSTSGLAEKRAITQRR
jgi:hypothetical protein